MCYQLSSRKLDPQSVENWTVFDQPSWQYLWAQTLVPLIYHSISNHHALSTAQLCWVGQIAKAHICLFWSWNLWYYDTVILFQFDYVSQIPVNNRHLFLFTRNVYFWIVLLLLLSIKTVSAVSADHSKRVSKKLSGGNGRFLQAKCPYWRLTMSIKA